MLRSLNISNFVLISRLKMDFHTGLTVLTGETGSGKSIIVDALGLLLGSRSFVDSIREGEQTALIEGLFELGDKKSRAAWDLLASLGIDEDSSGEIIIRREINANGRNRIYLNDRLITGGTLRALQPFLVEIHGQGEQQSLLSRQVQLDLLDNFAGAIPLRMRVAMAYARFKESNEALLKLKQDVAEKEQLEDVLRYQLTELKRVAPIPGEDEELAAERELLTHAEKLAELSSNVYGELYEKDDSILSRLGVVKRWLQDLSSIDSRIEATLDALESAEINLTDVAETLRDHCDGIDFSPARLDAIENRLAELERLKRKYNSGLSGFPKLIESLQSRVESFEDLSEREESLKKQIELARKDYILLAKELTSHRRNAATMLEDRVTKELEQVAMQQSKFFVRVETFEESDLNGDYYSPNGCDQVEFLISANPGESPRPLARVASGGELSRIMLTLRLVGGGSGKQLPQEGTLVFDEVDAGIGGRSAEAVGRRLKDLSKTQQVLCVTHQAQLARFADHHYFVSKSLHDGRTVTSVTELNSEERVQELARMIGGSEDSAPMEAARWLLESSSRLKPSTAGSVKRGKAR
jgi:DNA repair protein RecN (Recombination protein N)